MDWGLWVVSVDFDAAIRLLEEKGTKAAITANSPTAVNRGTEHRKSIKPHVGSAGGAGVGGLGSVSSDSGSVSLESSASITHIQSQGKEKSAARIHIPSLGSMKQLNLPQPVSAASSTNDLFGGGSGILSTSKSPMRSSQSQSQSSLAMSARKNESLMETLVAQDRREQLADALYRRAQAKLLLQGGDARNHVIGALKDAEQVCYHRGTLLYHPSLTLLYPCRPCSCAGTTPTTTWWG